MDKPVKIYTLSTCSHCKATKKLLDECKNENKTLRSKSQEYTDGLLNQMLMPLLEENDKLKKEITDLKEQIKQLKES